MCVCVCSMERVEEEAVRQDREHQHQGKQLVVVQALGQVLQVVDQVVAEFQAVWYHQAVVVAVGVHRAVRESKLDMNQRHCLSLVQRLQETLGKIS